MIQRFAVLIMMFCMAAAVSAAQPAVYQTAEGAIDGYDPVAYFVSNGPAKGVKTFTHRWNEADWYFVSAENRDQFRANPEKFAPQYGGY